MLVLDIMHPPHVISIAPFKNSGNNGIITCGLITSDVSLS